MSMYISSVASYFRKQKVLIFFRSFVVQNCKSLFPLSFISPHLKLLMYYVYTRMRMCLYVCMLPRIVFLADICVEVSRNDEYIVSGLCYYWIAILYLLSLICLSFLQEARHLLAEG